VIPARATALGAVLALVVLLCGCGDSGPLVFPEANLVLVSIDTLRADHLSVYGYDRETSPFLRELARSSVVFENAIAQSTWTTPSHAALFTSRYPTEMGLRTWPDPGSIPEDVPTIGEILSDAGLAGHAFTEGAWISGKFGFARGFRRYDDRGGRLRRIYPRLTTQLPFFQDERFFLFLHTYDVHWYDPSFEYAQEFVRPYSGSLAPSVELRKNIQHGKNHEFVESLTEEDLDYIVDLYDASIREVDATLRRFVERLRQAGIFDRTVVVITADHGEEFLEHGRTGHGFSAYEEQIRVPLILRLPGGAHGGKRIRDPVCSIDILPTVLDLLAVDHEARDSLRGRSLLPLLQGGEHAEPAFVDRGHVPKVSVRASRFKLIYDTRRETFEAYDLERDPREQEDLVGTEAPPPEELRRELVRFLSENRPPEAPGASVPLTAEDRERIEQLGYGLSAQEREKQDDRDKEEEDSGKGEDTARPNGGKR